MRFNYDNFTESRREAMNQPYIYVHYTSMYGPVGTPTFLMKFVIVSFVRYYFVRTLEGRVAAVLVLP
jgi:hypothetical protein